MSVWRIAGVVHAMEGWTEHECGFAMCNIEQVWKATLECGFQPLDTLMVPMAPLVCSFLQYLYADLDK